MKLAIVILNWNGRTHLEKYLPSVIEFSLIDNCCIIVADNGSTDNSVDFLMQHYPQIEIIQLDKNYGFAEGYNRALEHIDAELFCLLNSDVRVTQNWLIPIIDLFNQYDDVAAIQPKILSDRDFNRFEHAGAAGGFIDKYGYPFCRGRIMNVIEFDNGQYNALSEIFWASGACLFIRSNIFKDAGGFDPDYFAHMEEIDLCWRLRNLGHRIIYTPVSCVYHWGGATLEYNNPRKLFLNFRNSLWTLYKNYGGNHLRMMMIRRMLIDTFAIIKFLVCFDFKNAFAVVDAHVAYYKSKPLLKAKRELLLMHRVKKHHPEMLRKSIVWQFFVFSRKTFVAYKSFQGTILKNASVFDLPRF